jgi:hypothetical protein
MDAQTFRKFCPVCKLDNDADATICRHCHAPLDKTPEPPTTRRVDKTFGLSEELREQVTRAHTPPPRGLSLFLLNSSEPIALCMQREFVLGRGEDLKSEAMFDLTEFDAFSMGVSRRHAMIKAVEDKYELTDLNSSNGTWLNGERLLPNKPRDLPSGGVIQLGRLQLVGVYLHPPGSKKG